MVADQVRPFGWQPIVAYRPTHHRGYRPTHHRFAREVLACGHDGHHSPIVLIEQHMQQGVKRLCRVCTKATRQDLGVAICASKRRYRSFSQARGVAAGRGWLCRCYLCPHCRGWHLTSAK